MDAKNQNFQLVAEAIRYITLNATKQPSLDEISSQVGLSKFHFQRLFRHLAGVTPKQFLQSATALQAKRLLLSDVSVLDTSLDVGLSGPGRLHDLMINFEAMSPGEIKSGGSGLTITTGIAETIFGPCLGARTERGICRLSFLESDACKTEALAILEKDWPNANLVWTIRHRR